MRHTVAQGQRTGGPSALCGVCVSQRRFPHKCVLFLPRGRARGRPFSRETAGAQGWLPQRPHSAPCSRAEGRPGALVIPPAAVTEPAPKGLPRVQTKDKKPSWRQKDKVTLADGALCMVGVKARPWQGTPDRDAHRATYCCSALGVGRASQNHSIT